MESLLVGTLFVAGAMLVLAGAFGLPVTPRARSGVTNFIDHGKGIFRPLGRTRTKRAGVSPTDLILTDLLNELAELRREIADLRTTPRPS